MKICKKGHEYEKRCLVCRRETNKRWSVKNRHKQWGYDIKSKYGLLEEDYDRMLKEQNNVCKICLRTSYKRLVVDHCHKTGKVRGLLCSSCNRAIGYLQDSVENLERAKDYLYVNRAYSDRTQTEIQVHTS